MLQSLDLITYFLSYFKETGLVDGSLLVVQRYVLAFATNVFQNMGS